MSLRTIPIRSAGIKHSLFLGGDRELTMFSALMAGALIFTGMMLKSLIYGIVLWLFCLNCLRIMAKHDPMLRHVYVHSFKYKRYYPARSAPFRDNVKEYK